MKIENLNLKVKFESNNLITAKPNGY